jgi:O-acetylhomoserine/O-acetylserine sulfhydrylase-like pyridoxal-dependent enzyme
MKNIDTICVQAGYNPKNGEPRVTPIYQSTTFKYDTAADLAKLFDLKAPGYLYSRLANPTVSVLEKKMSEMEGGVDAIGLSSGQAAVLFAVLNVASMGDNVVSCSSIYGGVYNLFNTTLRKYGIETRFFSMDDSAEKIEKLVDEKTKVIYGETISNPTLVMLDFDKLAACRSLEIPCHALWVVPKEDMQWTDPPPGITRVLIGEAGLDSSIIAVMAVRRLVGGLLSSPQRIAIHLARSVQTVLYQTP